METAIQIYNSHQFGEIRTATNEAGEPLFCLTDLCAALKLKNATSVSQRLEEDERSKLDLGRQGSAIFVTEPGMYTVILRSDSPLAKPMKKWVTSEVLPAIRKTGGYIATTSQDTPELIIARAILVANEAIERSKKDIELLQSENRVLESKNNFQNALLDEQAPRVLFSVAVETSSQSCLIGELAKILQQNGVQMGQNRLFTWLRKNHYLGATGENYNVPTQRYMEQGLFEIKKQTISKPNGTTLVNTTSKVTGKGQVYFLNKFMGNKETNRN